jgi:hypothetical protein
MNGHHQLDEGSSKNLFGPIASRDTSRPCEARIADIVLPARDDELALSGTKSHYRPGTVRRDLRERTRFSVVNFAKACRHVFGKVGGGSKRLTFRSPN